MSGFEPSSDDVVLMKASENLISNTSTYQISQLKETIRQYFSRLINAPPTWLEEGVECQFLKAQEGGGWKKGKIRLRVEIVPDEPEPSPDANFLDDLRKDISPEQ